MQRVVVLAVALLAWEFGVPALKIPAYLVPVPSRIGARLVDGFTSGLFVEHTLVTMQEIFIGYVLGCCMGIGLGILISQYRLVENVLYPYIVGVNSVPKVATAPLIVLWFGFGLESKVVMVALVSFFPLLVNVILGLRSVDPDQMRLMRSLTATRFQTFRMVQLPNALPSIFAGLEVAIVLSVVGAIVGEFVGAKAGLGYYIQFANALVDTAGMFAIFIILAAIGLSLNFAVKFVARRIVFWRRDETIVESA